MKRRNTLSFVLLMISFAFYCQEIPREAITAAHSGYRQYLEKIPHGGENAFGFRDRAEFTKVKVGKPFRIYRLVREFYEQPFSGSRDYLTASDEYRFPLVLKKKYRVMITVAKRGDAWEIVNMGSADMAKELQVLEKQGRGKSDVGKILVATGINGDFLLVSSRSGTEKAVPFESARTAMGTGPVSGSSDLDSMLPLIKECSGKNQQSNR